MKKNKSWRIIFIVLIILYLILSIGTFLLVTNISRVYEEVEKKQYFAIKEEIFKAVKNNDVVQLEKIVLNNSLELAVYNNSKKELVFSSLPIISIDNFDDLKYFLNSKAVAYEETFEIVSADGVFYAWVSLYNFSPQSVLDYWIVTFVCALIVLLTIISVTMVILFYKMVKPLQRFRNNILKISSYQLDRIKKNEVHTEYDTLSKELFLFAEDLQNKIDKTGIVYTSLETNLQLQNEVMDYRSKMIASQAHDLKMPLNTLQLQIEDLEKKYNFDKSSDFKQANDRVYRVIDEVNNIVRISFQDNIENLKRIETFDLIDLLVITSSDFHELLDHKNIYIDYDIEEKIMIHANKLKIKQLIHNACSNLCAYSKSDSEAIISCFVDEGVLNLSFYNEADFVDENELNKAFQLFYRMSKDSIGTGTGLFTIKAIVDEYHGITKLKNYKNGIILEIKIDFKNIQGE